MLKHISEKTDSSGLLLSAHTKDFVISIILSLLEKHKKLKKTTLLDGK